MFLAPFRISSFYFFFFVLIDICHWYYRIWAVCIEEFKKSHSFCCASFHVTAIYDTPFHGVAWVSLFFSLLLLQHFWLITVSDMVWYIWNPRISIYASLSYVHYMCTHTHKHTQLQYVYSRYMDFGIDIHFRAIFWARYVTETYIILSSGQIALARIVSNSYKYNIVTHTCINICTMK